MSAEGIFQNQFSLGPAPSPTTLPNDLNPRPLARIAYGPKPRYELSIPEKIRARTPAGGLEGNK